MVVTGVGMVTPLGLNVEDTWSNMLIGKTGTKLLDSRSLPSYVPSFVKSEQRLEALHNLPCRVVAPVQSPNDESKFEATTRESRAQKFAMHAVEAALQNADERLLRKNGPVDGSRIGVNFGMGMPGLSDIADASWHLFADPHQAHPNKIGPYFVPKVLGNIIAGTIAMKYGFRGPNHSSMTACATGAHCIGDAARWIANDEADIVICGSAEACITPVSIAGFCRMKALATKFNDTPGSASRPFDTTRGGFIMGEGCGALVLEELESALKRKATIYGEVRGFGMSGDAYHVSSPHPEGHGVQQCIHAALKDAGVPASAIAYVNAHATSTPMGDEIELHALEKTLRPKSGEGEGKDTGSAKPVAVSSSKGAIGHLLGAAGAVEAIIALLALHYQRAPPTANLTSPIPHDNSRVVLPAEAMPLHNAFATLSTSFGFGGTNAALVFTSVQRPPPSV